MEATRSFQANEVPGIIIILSFAFLSSAALSSIIVRIVWLAILRLLRTKNTNIKESKVIAFFNTQLGYYAASLLIANMMTSIAGVMGLPFLLQRRITEGFLCIFQATFMQFGHLSTAYFTLAIAAHTLASLVFGKRQSPIVFFIIVCFGWAVSAIISMIPFLLPNSHILIYGVSGLSCGVKPELRSWMVTLHLLPIFVTAGASAAIYLFVFLVLRGGLVFGMTAMKMDRLAINIDKRGSKGYRLFLSGIAKSMLWYPVAYMSLLLPYSVTRLLVATGTKVPFQAMVFAFSCWFMLGIANAIGFYNTFRVLSNRVGLGSQSDPERTTIEKLPYPTSPTSALGLLPNSSRLSTTDDAPSDLSSKSGSILLSRPLSLHSNLDDCTPPNGNQSLVRGTNTLGVPDHSNYKPSTLSSMAYTVTDPHPPSAAPSRNSSLGAPSVRRIHFEIDSSGSPRRGTPSPLRLQVDTLTIPKPVASVPWAGSPVRSPPSDVPIGVDEMDRASSLFAPTAV